MKYHADKYAVVESDNIGCETQIRSFAHILPKAAIGSVCEICDHVFVDNNVTIGSRVKIMCGAQLWDGTTVEDDVIIGPGAILSTDSMQGKMQSLANSVKTVIKKNANVGANATILQGIVVGTNAVVGVGAVVIGDVPPNSVVVGSPARITGYVSASGRSKVPVTISSDGDSAIYHSRVPGVEVRNMPVVKDLRGTLSFGEYASHLPFIPKRYFIIYDVPSEEVRGEHSHKQLHQFLVCVKGTCAVVVDDGQVREEINLNSPAKGVYIPPMVWATQYRYSMDTVLLAFASDIYDPDDYIRDYDEFLSFKAS